MPLYPCKPERCMKFKGQNSLFLLKSSLDMQQIFNDFHSRMQQKPLLCSARVKLGRFDYHTEPRWGWCSSKKFIILDNNGRIDQLAKKMTMGKTFRQHCYESSGLMDTHISIRETWPVHSLHQQYIKILIIQSDQSAIQGQITKSWQSIFSQITKQIRHTNPNARPISPIISKKLKNKIQRWQK